MIYLFHQGLCLASAGAFASLARHSAALSVLAPGLVELDDPFGRLGQAGLSRRGDLGLAGLHALVTGEDQRLGLGELLLAEQAAAELASGC